MLRRPSGRMAAAILRPSFRFPAGTRALTSTPKDSEKAPPPAANDEPSEAEARMEAYRQVQNLDFMTAAKVLFTAPPNKKKFGLDFHLVQLFFACMPSLAVYLVAQYARYEIRRVEAEVEEKKKQAEEETKAKEAKMSTDAEGSDNELSKVIVRLDVLEETIKEIVDEKKKTPPSSLSKDHAVDKKESVASSDRKLDPRPQLETQHSKKATQLPVSGSGSLPKVAGKEST